MKPGSKPAAERDLPIIQSLWIGNGLSEMERMCASSFLKHGHPFHLYTYGEIAGIPEGVIRKDASDILPADKIFLYAKQKSYAGFSNLFRYQLLLEKGNYWVDMDMICLRPFPSEPEYVFSSQRRKLRGLPGRVRRFFGRKGDPVVNCGVLKAPAGSEIIRYCREKTNGDLRNVRWGEIGPKLVADAVERFGLHPFVSPPEVYCPVDFWEWNRVLAPGSSREIALDGAIGIHLWHEFWRRSGTDKSGDFPEDCLYRSLQRRFAAEEDLERQSPVYARQV